MSEDFSKVATQTASSLTCVELCLNDDFATYDMKAASKPKQCRYFCFATTLLCDW
jgi:hypothetical protein